MTTSQIATYKAALKEARSAFDKATEDLIDAQAQVVVLTDDISRLRRTITALAAMCSEEPGLDDLGITESCMEVMEKAKTQLTTSDVVQKLEDMGFDIAKQQNAPASVHAVLSRLAKKDKIRRVVDLSMKLTFWRGPNYNPKATVISDEDIPF